MKASWKTNILGTICILLALISACCVWVHDRHTIDRSLTREIFWNIFHVLQSQLALLAVGIALFFCAEHGVVKKHFKKHGLH